MVEVSQGEVCWADLPAPAGSGPGFRRPVIIVQGDHLPDFLAERVGRLAPKDFAQVMSGIDVVLGR